MDQATIARYQPGGDFYTTLSAQYGTAAADQIAAAAATGVQGAVAEAIGEVKDGSPLDISTLDILANQLVTDPLAAPLADANSLLNNTFLSFLTNPMVLIVVVVAIFLFFGGADLIRRKVKGS
jgi:hypothetical protein